MSQHQTTPNTIHLDFAVDRTEVGGKAVHLQRAISLGVRVPTGFVIPCSALTSFLAENALTAQVDHYLNQAEVRSGKELRTLYEMLCAAVMDAPLPPNIEQDVAFQADKILAHAPAGLAVRSSGIHEDGITASFAGVYASYLGITTHAALLEAIRRCWCATWSPGALAYAQHMTITLRADGMALIVQQVLPAESAGVVFTADPLTGDPWRFVINATYGLAQEMISGNAPGDSYVIAWDAKEILRQQIVQKATMLHGSKDGLVTTAVPLARQNSPALTHEQAREVARVALELDRAFDARVDIEWALTKDDIHVVQVRPWSALPIFFPHDLSESDAKQTWTLSDPVWYRTAKPGERLVAPFFRDRWALELWLRHSPGAFFPQQTGHERDFNGYRYQTKWHWEATHHSVDETIAWLESHEVEMRASWSAQQHAMNEVCASVAETVHNASTSAAFIPALLQVRAAEIDFTAATWGAPQWMIFTCEWLLRELLKEIAPDFAIGLLLQGLSCLSQTRTEMAQALGRGITETVVRSAFLDRPLHEVLPYLVQNHAGNHFLREYEAFCWQFGMIPPTWPKPWRGDDNQAQILLVIKKSMLGEGQDARDVLQNGAIDRAKAEADVIGIIRQHDALRLSRFQKVLAWAYYWTPELDNRGWQAGYIYLRLLDLMRQTGQILVDEGVLDDPTDLYLLAPEALTQISGSSSPNERRQHAQLWKHDYERNRRLVLPSFLGRQPAQPEDPQSFPQTAEHGQVTTSEAADTVPSRILTGDGLAPGHITGIARKTEDLNDAEFLDSLTSEDILIYPGYRTWPDWLSLFMVVKGVVMVQGVQVHHAAQIARECGVPFVNLPQDTWDSIPDKTTLVVDGGQGTVTVLA